MAKSSSRAVPVTFGSFFGSRFCDGQKGPGWTANSLMCITISQSALAIRNRNTSCSLQYRSLGFPVLHALIRASMNAVVVAMLLIAAAAAAGVPIIRWWSDRRLSMRELPPLVIPFRTAGLGSNGGPGITLARPARHVEEVVRPEPKPIVRADEAVRDEGFAPYELDDQRAVPNETVRFRRPVEEPVQLLPGRLEVLAGESRHHEIRFVRIPGEPMQLILGRDSGPSAQYVALKSSTVSRKHARLAFANGRWAVANLSQTNPVVLNDEELSHTDGPRDLADGDRLELGEVVLLYHAR